MGLALTLRPGEGVLIGREISVNILSAERNHIRVVIEAPREIHISRTAKVLRPRVEETVAPLDESEFGQTLAEVRSAAAEHERKQL